MPVEPRTIISNELGDQLSFVTIEDAKRIIVELQEFITENTPPKPQLKWYEFIDVTHRPDEGFKCISCGNMVPSLFVLAESIDAAYSSREDALCRECSSIDVAQLNFTGKPPKTNLLQTDWEEPK